MAEIEVSANIPNVVRKLNKLKRDQLPFATALALTRTAQDAQQDVRDGLSGRFTIRRRWVPSGIRIERATKTMPEAVVKSRDEFMTRQEFGGTKTKRQAVPKGIRRSKRTVVGRRRWPGALLRSGKRTFKAPLKGGDVGVFRRRGKKGRPIELLWALEDRVVVKPRFEFAETVQDTVERVFPRQFGEALARAIATAR